MSYVEDYFVNFDELAEKYNGEIYFEELRKAFFYKKTSRWQHEKEYRMVRPLTDSPYRKPVRGDTSYRDEEVYLFDFSLDCIAGIVFGAYMSISKKRLIESYCMGYDIQLLQSTVIRNQKDRFGVPGRVYYVTVEDWVYSMEPQLFCLDVDQPMNTERIRIESLRELPYYENNEDIVARLWARLHSKERADRQ